MCVYWYTSIRNGTELAVVDRKTGNTTEIGPYFYASSPTQSPASSPSSSSDHYDDDDDDDDDDRYHPSSSESDEDEDDEDDRPPIESITSLEWDFATKTMYAIVNERYLGIVDIDTARVDIVGDTSQTQLYGLAMSHEGVLYTYSRENRRLYRLSRQSGTAFEMFRVQGLWRDLIDLAYDYCNDRIMTIDTRRLMSIDPMTEESTVFGTIFGLPPGTRLASVAVAPKCGVFVLTNDTTAAAVYKVPDPVLVQSKFKTNSTLSSGPIGGTLQCNRILPDYDNLQQ